MGDQRRPQNLACILAHFLDRLDDANATALAGLLFFETALATATGVNLGLDDPDRSSEVAGDSLGLFGRVGDTAARHRHAEFGQQLFGLIFMDIHGLTRMSWKPIKHKVAHSAHRMMEFRPHGPHIPQSGQGTGLRRRTLSAAEKSFNRDFTMW